MIPLLSKAAATLILISLLGMNTQAVQDRIEVVARPPANGKNSYYSSNREPLAGVALIKLPVGAVSPRGWLRKQLELQADGFHGHLGEISSFLRKEKNAWLSAEGQGERGWEEVPYWLKGFGDCAYLLGREDQIREAKEWIEAAIKSQRADGFFGPRSAKATVDSTTGKYDLWPNMVMLCCLQSYFEFTGDQRVIDLMTKYFHWQLTVPDKDFLPPYWQQQRAADNLWSVLWLYQRTGDKALLELADKVHRHTANWTDGVADWHNVNMAEAYGGPAFYYLRSKDPRHLRAADRNYRAIREQYGQVPGGMFGGDEICRKGYADPRQAIETCGMVEEMFTNERLLAVSGDPIWADRCEDVAFNSLPAATTADMKALRYLTSPNLVLSDRQSKAPGLCNGGNMLEMSPHLHRCCQHNVGHGWPYFTEHLWMATQDNGLAAVMYSPCTVKAKVGEGTEVAITEETHYPFSGNIGLTLAPSRPTRFPLYLRIPAWCVKATASVNGKPLECEARGGQYLVIERIWKLGDRLELLLPQAISFRTWPRNHHSVSVDLGPLTYSLKIGEKYVRTSGTDRWPGYEIHPTTSWNYGLRKVDVDQLPPAGPLILQHKDWPTSEMPFTQDGVPVSLVMKARKIPEWKLDHLGLVGLLQDSPARSDQPEEEITLIPMGAARLRITAFPVVGSGPEAHAWKVPPEALPLKITASHCNPTDTVRAVAEEKVPENSNDHSVPRFTWWDHRGTREWIQREFDRTRKVSKVEVYWFDDEAGNGGCRVPQSWRLLYRVDGQWKEVAEASAYPVEKDRFNVTTFKPVETDALRIEVQLRDRFSGGVLQWRVP